MVDWIAQALARYQRASALVGSTKLLGMVANLDLAQLDLSLATDSEHERLAQRVGEARINLNAVQAEVDQIKTDIDNRIRALGSL